MIERAYPAAQHVAAKVQEHFMHHLGTNVPADLVPPDLADIESIVDAGFWASLRREEGTCSRSRWRSSRPSASASRSVWRPLPLATAPHQGGAGR